MDEEIYEDMLMDEFRGDKGDYLRQWARAHGCILMTPEDHFVLRERLSLAVAMAKEDADGLAIGEAIECLLDDLENEWRVSLQ